MNNIVSDIDKELSETIAACLTNPTARYEMRFVEDLLSQISSLLERCIVYRTELLNLQFLWTTELTSYTLNTKLRAQTAAIDEADVCFAETTAGSAAPVHAAANSKRGALKNRLDLISEHEDAIYDMHFEMSNALQFTQRWLRTWDLCKGDLTAACDKLSAVQKGLKAVFGIDPAPRRVSGLM